MWIFKLLVFLLFYATSVVTDDLYTELQKVVPINCRHQYQLKSDVNELRTCIFSKVVINIKNAAAGHVNNATTEICQSNLLICLHHLEDNVKNCLSEPDRHNLFDEPKKVLVSLMDYTCSNRGQSLKDFLQNGISCASDRTAASDLQKCNENAQNLQKDWIYFGFTSDTICRKKADVATCFVNIFNKCEANVKKFIAGVFYYVMKETRCKDIVDREYSDLSAEFKPKPMAPLPVILDPSKRGNNEFTTDKSNSSKSKININFVYHIIVIFFFMTSI